MFYDTDIILKGLGDMFRVLIICYYVINVYKIIITVKNEGGRLDWMLRKFRYLVLHIENFHALCS